MLFQSFFNSLSRLPDINLPVYRIGNLINKPDKITSYSFSFFFLLYRQNCARFSLRDHPLANISFDIFDADETEQESSLYHVNDIHKSPV